MAGIAGIILNHPSADTREEAEAMVAAMSHEAGAHCGMIRCEDERFHGGWVSAEAGAPFAGAFTNQEGAITLLFSGECFSEGNDAHDAMSGAALLEAYERHGIDFLESLNGLFSGFLIDRNRNVAHLFNDRYGIHRLYVHETEDAFFFASEAKAILKVVASTRAFDSAGVAEFMAYKCTIPPRSLYRGVEILPGASCCTFYPDQRPQRCCYFTPQSWEEQEPLSADAFLDAFETSFKALVPKYGRSGHRIGISLTGGLDTRMMMACLALDPETFVTFTYSGKRIDPLDARIAARIAGACGLEHHMLRLGENFFSEFGTWASRTVYATDGYSGVTGAHEIYFSAMAGKLAPTRLTGNYGSEILRGVSTFKPIGFPMSLLDPEMSVAVQAAEKHPLLQETHPVTFAAFKEAPWHLWGNLAAGRALLGFRTPYLDNAFVKMAYRGPRERDAAVKLCCALVRRNSPKLAGILTDRAYLGHAPGPAVPLLQAGALLSFKLDYYCSEGFPGILSHVESPLVAALRCLRMVGLHKSLQYRAWFADPLAGFVRDCISDAGLQRLEFIDHTTTRRLLEEHTSGRKNNLVALNMVLSLYLTDQLLLRK